MFIASKYANQRLLFMSDFFVNINQKKIIYCKNQSKCFLLFLEEPEELKNFQKRLKKAQKKTTLYKALLTMKLALLIVCVSLLFSMINSIDYYMPLAIRTIHFFVLFSIFYFEIRSQKQKCSLQETLFFEEMENSKTEILEYTADVIDSNRVIDNSFWYDKTFSITMIIILLFLLVVPLTIKGGLIMLILYIVIFPWMAYGFVIRSRWKNERN